MRTLGRPALSKSRSLLHARSLHECSVAYQFPLSWPPLEAGVPSEKQRLLFERNTDLPHEGQLDYGSHWGNKCCEMVTYSAEEHLEMNPHILSQSSKSLFSFIQIIMRRVEPGLLSGTSGSTSGYCFSSRFLGAQNLDRPVRWVGMLVNLARLRSA